MSTRSIILMIVLLGVITVSLLTWFDEPERVPITVLPSGLVLVEGKQTPINELEAIIHDHVEDDDKVEIVITADESIPVGDVLRVKETAERAGVRYIEIVSGVSP